MIYDENENVNIAKPAGAKGKAGGKSKTIEET
jgi:hypothetical protein